MARYKLIYTIAETMTQIMQADSGESRCISLLFDVVADRSNSKIFLFSKCLLIVCPCSFSKRRDRWVRLPLHAYLMSKKIFRRNTLRRILRTLAEISPIELPRFLL